MADLPSLEELHPGKFLAGHLAELAMSASELARHLGIPVNRVTHIINGQRGISGDSALRLGRFFGTPAIYWLELQMVYDVNKAEDENGEFITRTVPAYRDLQRSRKTPQGSLFMAGEVA